MVTVALDGPVGPLCAMNGDVTASVTNTSFYGDAELRTYTFGPEAGAPIYMAMIDEVDQQSMWDAPYSLVADGPYATNADDMTFGEPEPLIGPGANSLISVLLRVELSPHDTANVVGTFEIAPIPGPAALPAFGLLGLVAQRRRRRA